MNDIAYIPDPYNYKAGDSPLLISIPHSGTHIPTGMTATLNNEGRRLIDTDWYVDRLYPFASDLGASVISANYSRYVIDLNRDKNDTNLYPGQVKTGLCPTHSFDGAPLYQDGQEPSPAEIQKRIETYWAPYHAKIAEELQRKRTQHGYALLFDAHSIKSRVPRLFEGRLPDLNIGTNNGQSCAATIEKTVFNTAQNSPYDAVLNGRFVGGYITRHYGQPSADIHAIQMELIWDLYMDESRKLFYDNKSNKLIKVLHGILKSYITSAGEYYTL